MVVTCRVRIAYITTEKPYVIAWMSHMLRIRHTHSYHCIFDRVFNRVCACTCVRKAKATTFYATNYWNKFVNLCSFRVVYNNKFCYFAISHWFALLNNDEMKSNEINFDVDSRNSCKINKFNYLCAMEKCNVRNEFAPVVKLHSIKFNVLHTAIECDEHSKLYGVWLIETQNANYTHSWFWSPCRSNNFI